MSLYCFQVGRSVRVSPVPAPGRLAFVSSGAFLPSSGIAAADALCQSEATTAGRSGVFRAVLATTSASPASRFDLTGPPWVRVDGIRVAPTAAAFFQSATWDSAPNVTPFGDYAEFAIAVGGSSLTQPGAAADTCSDWSSSEGNIAAGRAVGTGPGVFFYELPAFLICGGYVNIACLED